MSTRIPDPGDPLEDEGVPGQESGLPGKRITGDTQDDMTPPAEGPMYAEEYGTTAAEQAAGEPLDVRLAREVPASGHPGSGTGDPFPDDEEERAGRLGQQDLPESDRSSLAGQDYGADAGGYEPEERAVRIDPEGY